MLTTHTFSSQVELVIRNIAAKAYEYRPARCIAEIWHTQSGELPVNDAISVLMSINTENFARIA